VKYFLIREDTYGKSLLWALPLIGLPPIINLLTETFPIFFSGRFPVEDFPATEMALVDAANIEAAKDLSKNARRVSLFGIFYFPCNYSSG
jgi:hypothetical protein